MAHLFHARADEIAARLEASLSVDAAERMHLELHLERCVACAERHERVARLTRALREQPPAQLARNDRQLIARAMMQAGRREETPGSRIHPLWAAVATALLLFAGIGDGLWRQTSPESLGSGAGRNTPPAMAEDSSAVEEKKLRSEPDLIFPSTSPNREPVVATERPCRGVRTSLQSGSSLDVTSHEAHLCRLVLRNGAVQVHVDPGARTRLSIDTPRATVRVLGTVFGVTASESHTDVTVYRGKVAVDTHAGSRRVRAGQRAVLRENAPEVAALSAADADSLAALAEFVGERGASASARVPQRDVAQPPRHRRRVETSKQRSAADVAELRKMLFAGEAEQARAEAKFQSEQSQYAKRRPELLTVVAESYAVEGQHALAVTTYEQVAAGPRSATAANALIAAANLNLDRLKRPRAAVELYEKYIRAYPTGSLREVAAVGRCRALARAGQEADAASCARAYLATHPRGRFERQVRTLLD